MSLRSKLKDKANSFESDDENTKDLISELVTEIEELEDALSEAEDEVKEKEDEIEKLENKEPEKLDLEEHFAEIEFATNIDCSKIINANLPMQMLCEFFFDNIEKINLEDLETLIKTKLPC